ncbi:MAG: PAS domain S-box protein, partial [Thiohalomonadales bacterium]
MTENKLTILLVEDNKAHAELIQRVLEEKGLCETLEICENLAAARLSIESNTPGLVIADLNLPDGKGTDLLESSHENNNYPVILMTSFGDENIAADAIKAGALDYVVKSPEAFIDLPSVINRVMREWQYITAKTDAQQALLLKEHEQDEILNFMINAVITIDQTGMVLSFNKAAETLFGYNTDEIIGQKVNRLMPEPYADKHDEYLQRYLNTGEAHVIGVGIEVDGQRKNKGIFPMRLYVAELPKDTQGKQRFVATCVDLTQIKQQEEQLRRSQKMDALGKLTGGIAHDYNNILGIVLGYAEQIDTHLSDENLVAKFSLRIQHAAERGSRLAKKLLAFSQHKQPDIVVMDINNFLHEQQDMLKKTLTARIKFTLTLENNIWPVELDSGDLEDAIINMSINAQHAMKSGGQLTISTSNEQLNKNDVQQLGLSSGDYVLLSITDTGSGMDTVTLENIFDPFYSTKGELGTGLGLSQVYGFVER